MIDYLNEVLQRFALDADVCSCERHGSGHINETYLVTTASGRRYILQKINQRIFRDVQALMENVEAVTSWLRQRTDDPRRVLELVKTRQDEAYYRAGDGACWRIYANLEDSICLQMAETPEDFYESAVAFGQFQQLLQDFPADSLHEIIPNFHNTPDRYRAFKEVLAADPMGRAKEVEAEIRFALDREQEAGQLVRLLEAGKLPLRVTHNDTKLNNVLLDKQTRKALCVIDLDTVMPGLSLYDFGDSIRFGASSAAEDEPDLSKVELRLDLFEVYTRGFLRACPGLTELECRLLPLGAKTITLENGVRFLADYLDGDHYYPVHRPGHNLDRARTHFKLVADMEAKWSRMHEIVQEVLQELQ